MKTPILTTLPLLGASLGIAAFFAVAFVPAVRCGGDAGRLLAQGVLHAPGAATFAAGGLVALGALLGALAVAGLFAAGGAALGAAADALTAPGSSRGPSPRGR